MCEIMKNWNWWNIEWGWSVIESAGKWIIGGSKTEIAENFLNEEQQKLRGEIQVMLEERSRRRKNQREMHSIYFTTS